MGFYLPTQSMQICCHNFWFSKNIHLVAQSGHRAIKKQWSVFQNGDPTFPISFPHNSRDSVVSIQSQVGVTVSKNALKLRLFNIGTPFLTLGLSGEQGAAGERNVQTAGQQSANAFIRTTSSIRPSNGQSMKCSFSASGPFSDTSCNQAVCDHWVTTRNNWQVSATRSTVCLLFFALQTDLLKYSKAICSSDVNRKYLRFLTTNYGNINKSIPCLGFLKPSLS